MNQCCNNHQKCIRDLCPWYPTRLLHIDRQTRKVKLVISKVQVPESPYVTLSHRWPKVMPVKLLSSNTAQFQSGIETSGLPEVFKDAINITHHLGFHYLWIDSLCIQQDEDLLDWMIESQQMSQVYSNAILNLSATLAATGQESLLQDRSLGPLAPSKVRLLNADVEDYYMMNAGIWKDEVDNASLNQRAWVYQERFLAHRILHFGSRQLGWECHEVQALEMFPEGLHRYAALFSNSKPRVSQILVTSAPISKTVQSQEGKVVDTERQSEQPESVDTINDTMRIVQDENVLKFVDEYHKLVETYSACHLTWSKDKLIAFSGVSNKISEMIGDGSLYVSGVWNHILPFNLNWQSEDDSDEDDNLTTAKDLSSFKAPTWSWASAIRPVSFPSQSQSITAIFIKDWTFSEQIMQRKFSYVDSSSVHLKGVLFSLQMKWSDEAGVICFQTESLNYEEAELSEPGGPSISIDGSEKEAHMLSQHGKIWWLPLMLDNVDLHGIILAKTPRKLDTYRRLGRIQVPVFSMFQHEIGQRKERPGRGSRGGQPLFDPSNRVMKQQNEADWKGKILIDGIKKKPHKQITLR
jgi:Heterokaryon incompatibility protein (HET)